MRRRLPLGLVIGLLLGIVPSTATVTAAHDREVALDGISPSLTGDADVRERALRAPSPAAARAAASLARSVPGLRVAWNARMGTAKHVLSDTGFLTESAGGAISSARAERIARGWLSANRDLFGLRADTTLDTTRDGVLPDGGPHAFVFRVRYGSIPTFAGGTVGVNVARDGRIVSAWGSTGPAGSLDPRPRITAAQAVRAVAAREGVKGFEARSLGQRATGDRLAIFAAAGGVANHNARLVAFPTADGPRLAWRVFFAKGGEEMLSTAVDASTGVVLFRHNQVDHADGDKGRVYRNHPGAPKGGRQEVVSFEGDPTASPDGWVGPAPTTAGNNVIAFTDWTWPKAAGSGAAPALALAQFNPVPDSMPIAPNRSFDFTHTDEWSKACDPVEVSGPELPEVGSTDTHVAENPSYVRDREASVTNIFYFGNVIHDYAYRYGFTEPFGNMQTTNHRSGGKGQDAIRFMAQAGIANGQLNNAFMFTPADGGEPQQFAEPQNPTFAVNYIPPFSGMYLWRPIPSFQAPCVDGDFDASTAYHEYAHGISNRMTGGGDDADALNAHQSGSMGEAWSDWIAHIILDAQNLEDRTADGIYITGNAITGIRHFRLDQNPLTYADMGFGRFGPEVHDDGEIWSGTLWDLRNAFVKKYGKRKGIDVVSHLVFQGMAIQPRLPDMLDARDAILAADRAKYRGANQALLWSAFAKRGMGRSAKSKDASDVNPKPGFDAPSGNGTFAGTLVDQQTGRPIAGKVLVGLGEGKPTPAAAASRTGSFRIPMTPGTYPVSVATAGYGIQKIGSITVGSGRTTTKVVRLQRNLASVGWGARVASGLGASDPGVALIDDHEFTGQLVTVGKPVVVRLGAAGPTTVSAVSVSPKPASGGTTQNATGYKVELSADGRKWTTVMTGGVKRYKPRPSALQWMRPTRVLPRPMSAQFARLTVTASLGGGSSAILSGLQVYGTSSRMAAALVGGEKPWVDPNGGIELANAGGPGATITGNEFLATCSEPASQALDAYVVTMPDNAGDGVHLFETKGGSESGRDLDVYFYDAECGETGDIASGSADESGPIPPGSKYALVVLYAGSTSGFRATVTTTLERVVPPAGVGYARPPSTGGTKKPVSVQEREYIGIIGDVASLNCDRGVEDIPALGAACFPVTAGRTVKVDVTDDTYPVISGLYAFRETAGSGVDEDLTEFCGSFTTTVPPGMVEVVVYLETVGFVSNDCGDSEPATTGFVTARMF